MSNETQIHPTAVIEQGAKLGAGVRIGPFCHVGSDVTLGDGVTLLSHVSVAGATTIGDGGTIHPHAVLGGLPQNLKHKGGRTTLIIGRNAVIRESATLNAGTDTSRGETRVGDNVFMMAYTHVAHDCILGNNVVMANNATLGGHVEVGDFASLGGLVAVHQFVRIGHHAFVAGTAGVAGDIIPYGMAFGNHARLRGFNIIGLKRSGMARSDIRTLREAYAVLFSEDRPMVDNAEIVRDRFGDNPAVRDIVDFVTQRGKRHFVVPERGSEADADGDDQD